MSDPQNSYWVCPNCNSPLEKPAGQDPSVAPRMVECSICGAKFEPSDAADVPPDALPAAGAGPTPPPPTPHGGRNPMALVAAAVIVAAMLYVGFHAARRSAPTHSSFAGKSSVAPDFTLESLDGKNMRLSDFRGKAVLLNFWATWCGPCKIEMPWFVELQNQYGTQGLQIVGVAMDDSAKEDIAKFVKDMGVNYPVLLGKEAVGDAYGGVPALPESFFISRDGKIVDKFIGLRGKAEVEEAIKAALESSSSNSAAANSAETQQAQK